MEASIQAIGFVSALGLDWETGCAASRAGVLRARKLEHFRVQASDDPTDIQSVTGHQIDLLTRGFEGFGRWSRILNGALKDLRRNAPSIEGEVLMLLSMPDERTPALPAPDYLEEYQKDSPPEPDPVATALALTSEALKKADLPFQVALHEMFPAGQACAIEMLARARTLVETGQARHVLVVVIDSLLDDTSLLRLQAQMRLKNPSLPACVIPGEAGVAMLLTHPDLDPNPLGIIEGLGFDQDENSFDSGNAPNGRAASRVIHNVTRGTKWLESATPWLLSDHNGEYYRAADWGGTLQRLIMRDRTFARAETWFPIVSFGDARAANPAVALACALAAWQRNYAPADSGCIVSSSDDGRRAAMLIRKVEG